MPSNTMFIDACAVMRRARAEHIVDPLPYGMMKWVSGNRNLWNKMLSSVRKEYESRIDPDRYKFSQSTWQLPTTRRFLHTQYPSETAIVQPNIAVDWMIELARFPVPEGSIGIIKSFDQYLAQGETVYSSSVNWGNPFAPPELIHWYFRLSPIRIVGEPWINVSGLSAIRDYLPGAPYDDLSTISGIWYPTGSASSANIHLPIPGGNVLRIFAIVPPSQEAYSISTRLSGTTQSETSNDAQYVARTTW